ncbi:MAG: hypothetical protein ACT4NL_15245 [Pseudomarimonas sp.]
MSGSLALAQSTLFMDVSAVPFRGVSKPGDLIRFQVTAGRSGTVEGLNPTLEIELPAGLGFTALSFPFPHHALSTTCAPPAIGSAGVVRCALSDSGTFGLAQINIDVRIAPTVAVGTLLMARAEVRSQGIETNLENNLALIPTLVQSGSETADLQVRVSADQSFVTTGSPVTFRIVVENAGPDVAAWPSFTYFQPSANLLGFALPRPTPALAGTQLTLADGWTCVSGFISLPIFPSMPSSLICSAVQLPAGATTVVATMRGNVNAIVASPIRFSATTATPTFDPNTANNDSGEVNVVIGFPPAQSIPSNSPWLLAALALLLGMLAMRGLARTR